MQAKHIVIACLPLQISLLTYFYTNYSDKKNKMCQMFLIEADLTVLLFFVEIVLVKLG